MLAQLEGRHGWHGRHGWGACRWLGYWRRRRWCGGNQAFGGGMGGMGGGMGGMGGGMWSVPPRRRSPSSAFPPSASSMASPIRGRPCPIRSCRSTRWPKPEVAEVLRVAPPANSPAVAQVAAWHLNNDMSWQELARSNSASPTAAAASISASKKVFLAMQLVERASKNVREQQQQYQTPSQSTALSQSRPLPANHTTRPAAYRGPVCSGVCLHVPGRCGASCQAAGTSS